MDPLQNLETLKEVEFLLLYYVKGMTPDRVSQMDQEDRLWWMKRLTKEKKRESPRSPLS